MTQDLETWLETCADIAYSIGAERVKFSEDSVAHSRTIVSITQEFMRIHEDTDWSEVDYIETIDSFIEEKIKQHEHIKV